MAVVLRLPALRILLSLLLATALPACQNGDAELEHWFALQDAIGPIWHLATATQWYESENGRWPTSIDQVADLDEVLGQVIRQPPEPVPIPGASAFNAIRFEATSDSVLRLHFDLAPFNVPRRGAVDIYDEHVPSRVYSPPATTVSRSVASLMCRPTAEISRTCG